MAFILGKRVLSAEEWSKKYATRAKASGADWLKAVLSPSKNPIEAALKATAKRKAKVEESLRDGTWEKSMAKVDQDLMILMIEKGGAAAYENAVDAKQEKQARKIKLMQPMVEALALELDKMPDVTDADREKKMIAAKNGMKDVGRKLRAS